MADLEHLISEIVARHTDHARPLDIAIAQGRDLIALKAACRHGEFQRLVNSQLPFGYSVAANLMRLNRQSRNLHEVSNRSSKRHSSSVNPHTTSCEWYTPVIFFDTMQCEFDVDVASPGRSVVPWIPAREHLTANSLETDWEGFIWMNPPFGGKMPLWTDKFARHGNGVALVPDRTSTAWWQRLSRAADHVLFVRKRIPFVGPEGRKITTKPSYGTTLMSLGEQGSAALYNAAHAGLGTLLNRS